MRARFPRMCWTAVIVESQDAEQDPGTGFDGLECVYMMKIGWKRSGDRKGIEKVNAD